MTHIIRSTLFSAGLLSVSVVGLWATGTPGDGAPYDLSKVPAPAEYVYVPETGWAPFLYANVAMHSDLQLQNENQHTNVRNEYTYEVGYNNWLLNKPVYESLGMKAPPAPQRPKVVSNPTDFYASQPYYGPIPPSGAGQPTIAPLNGWAAMTSNSGVPSSLPAPVQKSADCTTWQKLSCGISCGDEQCGSTQVCMVMDCTAIGGTFNYQCGMDATCGRSASASVGASGQSSGDCTAKVTSFYQDLLGRDPEASGLSYWVQQCTSGAQSFDQIRGGFLTSAEFQQKHTSSGCLSYVTGLYKTLLGREPDKEGLSGWAGACASQSATLGNIRQQFLSSPEYLSKH